MGYDPSYGVNPPGLFGDPNVDPMWSGVVEPGGSSTFDENGPPTNGFETWQNPVPGMDDQRYLYGNGAPTTGQNQDWSWMNQGGSNGGTGSPVNWEDYIRQVTGIGGDSSGSGMSPRDQALFLASMGMAGKQWNDAGKYMDKTDEWAKDADPFGDQRSFYEGKLKDLYTDPNYLENMPAYKARMQASLNTLGPQMAAKGGGYGNAAGEMIKAAQTVASTEFDNEAKRLSGLAGAQFGPEAAARMRLGGLDASIRSQNSALGSMMFPFGSGGMMGGNGPGQNNNRTGGGSNKTGGGTGVGGTNFSAAQIAQLAQASGLNPASVMNILKGGGNGPEAAQFIRDYGGPNNQMQQIPGMEENPYQTMNPGAFNPDQQWEADQINFTDLPPELYDITGGNTELDFSAFGFQDLGF
jgi:hypothetical protein